MKTIFAFLLIMTCALPMKAWSFYSPFQREAVSYYFDQSGTRPTQKAFLDHLNNSKVLTTKELKRFPEVIEHDEYHYVLIKIRDEVYEIAIVIIDPDGRALNILFIDFDNRHQ